MTEPSLLCDHPKLPWVRCAINDCSEGRLMPNILSFFALRFNEGMIPTETKPYKCDSLNLRTQLIPNIDRVLELFIIAMSVCSPACSTVFRIEKGGRAVRNQLRVTSSVIWQSLGVSRSYAFVLVQFSYWPSHQLRGSRIYPTKTQGACAKIIVAMPLLRGQVRPASFFLDKLLYVERFALGGRKAFVC